jgi:tetratricopeptide (TPR) repeat protein
VAVVAVTVLAGLLAGRFVVAGDGGEAPAARPAVAGGGAAAEVARLQAEVRRRPGQPRLLTRLGVAYLARARETADPAWYAKAAGVLGQASKLAPDDPETMVARGLLDLGRHDFRSALAWGTRAARANPDLPDALGVMFDAEVELGRYQAAVATAQAMVDRKPAQGSLARVSYARELLGDPAGAVAAMVQAAAAGGSPADQAYVQTLLGNLHLGAGRLAPAEAAYRRALGGLPSAGLAEVGLARVAAARGDLAGAARLLEPVADRLPLPATVALLGDVRAALGDPQAAAAQYRLVRVIERLNQANGVAVDLELARFEADHRQLDPGADPRRGVALARRAMAERPTIYAADTLGWALRQAGQPRASSPPRPGGGPARHPRRRALVPPGHRRGRPRHDGGRPPPPGRGVRHLPLPDRARPAHRAGPGRAAPPARPSGRRSGIDVASTLLQPRQALRMRVGHARPAS